MLFIFATGGLSLRSIEKGSDAVSSKPETETETEYFPSLYGVVSKDFLMELPVPEMGGIDDGPEKDTVQLPGCLSVAFKVSIELSRVIKSGDTENDDIILPEINFRVEDVALFPAGSVANAVRECCPSEIMCVSREKEIESD